jgi:hypothetical protein
MVMDSEDMECVVFHTLKDLLGMKHFNRSVILGGVKANCRLGGYASTEEERNIIVERVIQLWNTFIKEEQ